ncbi:MAG: 4-hydroxy-tetrahydrodipicolinate reductase [Eubacteriales bacterium]
MIKILFCGACGRMGRATYELTKGNDKYSFLCGVDVAPASDLPYPIYTSIGDCPETPDVIVDFSHHTALPAILDYAVAHKVPAVICTTGHTEEETALMKTASEKIPVFFSRNMSVGINLLIELSKKAAALLGEDFNIEIVEAHHNQKLDAPSGTALMIADEIRDTVDFDAEYVYDRHSVRKKRDPKEIGIHSIRAGSIVGEHSVIFGGPNEVITLSHSALSRSVFANGALRAAEFVIGKPAGMYDMSDVIRNA